jgi:hypothetical protein
MKGLIAALTVACGLVLASPAAAHTWGGNLYMGGSNPGSSYVTVDEAHMVATMGLRWVEGLDTLRWNAHDRVNSQLLWIGIRSTNGALHQCATGWNPSHAGPTPYGWAVRCQLNLAGQSL